MFLDFEWDNFSSVRYLNAALFTFSLIIFFRSDFDIREISRKVRLISSSSRSFFTLNTQPPFTGLFSLSFEKVLQQQVFVLIHNIVEKVYQSHHQDVSHWYISCLKIKEFLRSSAVGCEDPPWLSSCTRILLWILLKCFAAHQIITCCWAMGTKLVWNSVRSKLRVPSNLREAVIEDTTWPISLLRLRSRCSDYSKKITFNWMHNKCWQSNSQVGET